MKALYDARIEDLGPGDFVRVECAGCGHDELLPAMSFSQGLQLPHTRIVDLQRRFRCRECDAKEGDGVGQMGD